MKEGYPSNVLAGFQTQTGSAPEAGFLPLFLRSAVSLSRFAESRTMCETTLRARLEAKKAEIEQALILLDKIELLASGDSSGDAEHALPLPVAGGTSVAQQVLDEIVGKSLTVDQIAGRIGVSPSQVRNALTGHRLRRVVRSSKAGGLTRYSVPANASGGDEGANGYPGRPTLSESVVALLDSEPGQVWSAGQVGDALNGKVRSTAKNFQGAVSATLSNLTKAGRVKRGRGGYVSLLSSSTQDEEGER